MSIGLSVQEKTRKNDFQDDDHLGFLIGTISAIFDLQFAPILLSFRISWPSVLEKKRKTDVQDEGHGGHLGFQIRSILAIFDLQLAPIHSFKFRMKWPFGSGEEARNRFSRWRPSWIFHWNDFQFVSSTRFSDTVYQISSRLALGCGRSSLLKQIYDATGCTLTDHIAYLVLM